MSDVMNETFFDKKKEKIDNATYRLAYYDKEQGELTKAVIMFVETKHNMSQNEKWEAFDKMHAQFAHLISREELIEEANRIIRRKGYNVR